MSKFIVQYSVPTETRIAVSDWLEREKTIEARDVKHARELFHAWAQHLGTWMLLDILKEEEVRT